MSGHLFAKRARPGPPQRGARRTADSDDEVKAGNKPGALGGGGVAKRQAPRKAVSVGGFDDEDGAEEEFRVKKTKLSRQMAATGAPVGAAPQGGKQPRAAPGPDSRCHTAAGKRRSETDSLAEMAVLLKADEDSGVAGPPVLEGDVQLGADAEDEENDSAVDASATEAVRLARAQRAAARASVELGSGKDAPLPQSKADYVPMVRPKTVPLATPLTTGKATSAPEDLGTEKSSPFEAGGATERAVVLARGLGDPNEEVDAVEAWALQQMRVGAHRRRGGPVSTKELADMAGVEAVPVARGGAALPTRTKLLGDTGINARGNAPKLPTPAEAMANLWEAMKKLEGGVEERSAKADELKEQRLNADDQLKEIERKEKGLDKGLRAAQELDELAWGLGGLLDAKAPKLRQARDTLAQMEKEAAGKRYRRRLRCLADDLCSNGGATISKPTEEHTAASSLEAAAVDALRKRRQERQMLRKQQKSEMRDGWDTSSDSEQDGVEEWACDRTALCAAAHKQILGDVAEQFSSAKAVLLPITSAKKHLQAEYDKAFVPMSLPETLQMHISQSLLRWDPLQLTSSSKVGGGKLKENHGPTYGTQLEDFDWFSDLASFTEMRGDDDPDAELVPQMIQKCVFPEVTRRLRDCWDVTSATQSERVALLLDECIMFETDEENANFGELLKAARERLEQGLSEHAPEVFVAAGPPLERWYASSARWRLLWRSCKIARCAMMLDGRLPDNVLQYVVLSAVWATRIAPHLKSPRTERGEMALVEKFVALLPAKWLQAGLPSVLAPLRDVLGPRAPTGVAAEATAESAARVLQALRCMDEAQAIVMSMKRR
eukprot:TRINITY_DN30938_c0_g1_i1.p1 TRINITY_DN30938_c0_g1~~TRINITY_DN30938_c0_g1_i1.p1  ORF type:complete len:834 (+),score=230.02 TRINITY_DN30938_c0_g1_i1:97-2598(+)